MKKILFFLESLSGGGAEKVLSDLVTNLDKSKYDITVCTVTDEGVYQDKVSQCCNYYSFIKMKDIRKGGWTNIWTRIKIKLIYSLPANIVYRLYLKNKYDIEIAFIEGFATKLIASSCNKFSRKIAWVHTDMKQNPYADNSYKNKEEHIKTYLQFDKIICVSEYVKNVFESKFIKSENVIVSYNPVDDCAIMRMSRETCEMEKPKCMLIGTVGRLVYQKGYFRLVKCIKELKDRYDFQLWIIGEGPARKEIELYIRENSMDGYVKLLGFQKNPYKYLVRCDAFICSSYAEGFSTAATESLILGKPVFTVECAGMKELFGNYKCGEIVDNTDQDLLNMLEKLVSNQYKFESYVENISIRKKDFSIGNAIKNIENLLDY